MNPPLVPVPQAFLLIIIIDLVILKVQTLEVVAAVVSIVKLLTLTSCVVGALLILLWFSETSLTSPAALGSTNYPHFLALFLGLDPDLTNTCDLRGRGLWVFKSAPTFFTSATIAREHWGGLATLEASTGSEPAAERRGEGDLGRLSGSAWAENGLGGELHG